MVAVLPDFLICTHLHCFPFMTSNPLPALHSFAPIVSPILRDSPPYSCLTGTDLYSPLLLCHCYLDSYPCLTVFLTLPFHSFPCSPFYSFPRSFPCSPVLQFSSFPCLTVFLVSLFLACVDPLLDMDPSRISNAHLLFAYINPL